MLQAGYHCHAVEHSPEMVAAGTSDVTAAQSRTGRVSHPGFGPTLAFSNMSLIPRQYLSIRVHLRSRCHFRGGACATPRWTFNRDRRCESPAYRPYPALLVLIQALVYGPSALFGPRKQRNLVEEVARTRDGIQSDKRITRTQRNIETGL